MRRRLRLWWLATHRKCVAEQIHPQGGPFQRTSGMAPSSGASANGEKPPGGTRRSDMFLKGLARYQQVTLVSHVHPDPDSLGSMLGLAHLVQKKLGLPVSLTQDGFIGRAENQAMVAALDIDLTPIEEVAWGEKNAI